MKDLFNSISSNNMKLEVPAEYAEYVMSPHAKMVFHDPENDEQARIANKVKKRSAIGIIAADVLFVLLLIFVIVGQKQMSLILMVSFMTILITVLTIRTLTKKVQVAIGRAVVKKKELPSGKLRTYEYFAYVAVDKPTKTIYPRIVISEEDYNKIKVGTPMLIGNLGSGKGVVLD